MSWDAVGALAELLGAFAVIVSVLYLAAQVRHGAADVRANIIHSLHSKEVDLSALPASSTVLGKAVEKAYLDQELSDEERAVYSMWLYASWINFQQTFQEYQRLEVSSDVLEAERLRLAGGMRSRLARAVWRRLKDRYSVEFQDYVENECMPDGERGA